MTALYVQIIQWAVGIFVAALFMKIIYEEIFHKKDRKKEKGLEDLED